MVSVDPSPEGECSLGAFPRHRPGTRLPSPAALGLESVQPFAGWRPWAPMALQPSSLPEDRAKATLGCSRLPGALGLGPIGPDGGQLPAWSRGPARSQLSLLWKLLQKSVPPAGEDRCL